MTQTPETKTPTRAEALADLESLHYQDSQGEWIRASHDDFEGFIRAHYQTIKSALSATDAPIVEGLDEACLKFFDDWFGPAFGPPEHLDRIAQRREKSKRKFAEKLSSFVQLYAQGRTQSAVPEVQKSYPCGCVTCVCNTEDRCLGCGAKSCKGFMKNETCSCRPVRQESTAPPVTGGAWLPIETAPRDGTRVLLYMTGGKQCVARTEHHPFGGPMWVVYGEMGKPDCWCLATEDEETTPTHWQPLPAPPSSAEKEGK